VNSAILLGVNVDHIATIRQARGTQYPDPVRASFIAVEAGADGITVHLREDRRHIQELDVRLLSESLKVPLNLEMAATPSMIDFALQVGPEKCCIVPEKRQELTTEGGLDVCALKLELTTTCTSLSRRGIEVSLFIDPEEAQIEAAASIGVPVVELHTGAYAEATNKASEDREFDKIVRAARFANEANLKVNAGHGLHYENVARIASISFLEELNIGHAIVAEALFDGLSQAVRRMRRAMERDSQ
jgi:pyridoxine 5-phosphate synthase